MNNIRGIGFDLFNTLITAERKALDEAMGRLTHSLQQSGLALEEEAFKRAHRDSALRFIRETRKQGIETHNRFWISAALQAQGIHISPVDPKIARGVDAYFSAFLPNCHLIPGTTEMLEALKGPYRLGLLSNFTHGPAARDIIDGVGLSPFFEVVIISGELGYCKPHPLIFRQLVEQLGVEKDQIIYVGDDPEPDIAGAQRAGLHPVWMTYVRDRNLPLSPGVASGRPENPDGHVPRISSWGDLFDLLEES